MKFKKMLRRSWKSLKRASPTILAVVSGAGVIVTAVLSAKATPKALSIKEAYEASGKEDKKTTYKAVLDCCKCYVPTAVSSAVTIACIFGGHAISQNRQKALMGAYVALGAAFSNYKAQVAEICGPEVEEKVQEAADKFAKEAKNDEHLYTFVDDFRNEPFERTWGDVLAAEYNVNYFLQREGYVCLNQFYKELGLSPIKGGDDIGWSFDTLFDEVEIAWIPFINTPFNLEDGMKMVKIEVVSAPNAKFLADW